jgi:hypothetical protein
MFVVFAVIGLFKKSGGNLWWGILWYLPALAVSWLLGWLVAKYISIPCEHALRGRFMGTRPALSSVNAE